MYPRYPAFAQSFFLVCATCVVGGRLVAQPIPPPSIDRWVAESDLILRGRIVAIAQEDGHKELHSVREAIAKVQIDGIIKGAVKSDTIEISYKPVGTEQEGSIVRGGVYQVKNGECDLFFLSNSSNGLYRFADAYQGPLPVTCSGGVVHGSSTTEKQKIEALLATSLSDPIVNAGSALTSEIGLLGRTEFMRSLHEFASSDEPTLKWMAHAALIRMGDYSLMHQAVTLVLVPSADPAVNHWKSNIIKAISLIGEDQIRRSLDAGGRSTYCPASVNPPFNRSALRLLISLLKSPDVDLRRASVHALRGICDSSSAVDLARALDDSDPSVQYNAMMGLAALEDFPKALPTPTETTFEENPGGYLAIWKDWWAQKGRWKYKRVS